MQRCKLACSVKPFTPSCTPMTCLRPGLAGLATQRKPRPPCSADASPAPRVPFATSCLTVLPYYSLTVEPPFQGPRGMTTPLSPSACVHLCSVPVYPEGIHSREVDRFGFFFLFPPAVSRRFLASELPQVGHHVNCFHSMED